MRDTFKKTIIWTNVEPPRNYLWAKNNKVYEYLGEWAESKLFNEDYVPVDRVGLNKSKLNLKLGRSANLAASVEPEETSDKTLTWISSNPEIVEVSCSGRVRGVSEGTATVFVALCGKCASCEITVS